MTLIHEFTEKKLPGSDIIQEFRLVLLKNPDPDKSITTTEPDEINSVCSLLVPS